MLSRQVWHWYSTHTDIQLCHRILSHVCLFLQIKALLISSRSFFDSETVQGLSHWDTLFTYFTDKIDQFQEFSNSVGAVWKPTVGDAVFLLSAFHTLCLPKFLIRFYTLSPSLGEKTAILKNGKMQVLVMGKNISSHQKEKVANIAYKYVFDISIT